MVSPTKCRRCGECVGSDHHWIESCDPDIAHWYECKHCDAVADECPQCGDDGQPIDGGSCDCCYGSGIIKAD